MLTIFASFVAGIIVGKMRLVVFSRSLMAIVLLFTAVFGIWALSNPREAGHWAQYYGHQWFGIAPTAAPPTRGKS